MPDLRFEIERSQLRGLALFGVALAIAGPALTAAWWWGAPARVVGIWAVALDVSAVLALYAWVAFRRAYSEFSPAGIRTRGLTWTRTVPWDRVRAVVLAPARRTVTVVVIRDRGRRVVLGAPVHGGVMSDPDFDRKVGQIQDYVDRIDSAAPGRGERLVGPELGPFAADLGHPSFAERLSGAVIWVMLPAFAAGMLLYIGVGLPTEIQAGRGAGSPGVFVVTETHCRPSDRAGEPPRCSAVGGFLSDDGRVVRERQRLVGAPQGLREGRTVRAQWVSVTTSDVYTDPYRPFWWAVGGMAALCLLGLGWWGHEVRGRWRQRSALRRIRAQTGDRQG